MLSQKLIEILKDNDQIRRFLKDIKNFDILIRELNQDEINRLTKEYSTLFIEDIKIKKKKGSKKNIRSITIVRRDNNMDNYIKIKKIKLYLDEETEKIIKILQN